MARPFDHIAPTLRTWGSGEARILILPGAGQTPACWEALGQALAGRGLAAACLEYPGHGEKPWPLPPATRLRDYFLLAARAAAGLGRPLIVGHDMGGWLALRLLGLADMAALLLAPWPLPVALFGWAPRLAGKLLRGRPLAPGLLREPFLLRWQAALGMGPLKPTRKGGAPCLVAAPELQPLIPPARLAGLAGKLGAEFVSLPQSGHHLWREPQAVLELILRFNARI
jgi:pimeloyl-ACP methyl ester carboxylesterase